MTIIQNLESDYLAAHSPNKIIIEDSEDVLDATVILHGATAKEYTIRGYAFHGRVEIDLQDITRLVYGNLKNYVDPFDYTATKLYTEHDNYHYMLMDVILGEKCDPCDEEVIAIVNGNPFHLHKNPINGDPAFAEVLQVNDIVTDGYWDQTMYVQSAIYLGGSASLEASWDFVDTIEGVGFTAFVPEPSLPIEEDLQIIGTRLINAALQINEDYLMSDFQNNRLGEKLTMPIWEGYPHSTSVLLPNGINRILDYSGIGDPDLTYASEFLRGCSGVYLKWLNPKGGYSYWLFDHVYTEEIKSKSLGQIVNHYDDRRTAMAREHSLGKEGQGAVTIATNATYDYMREVSTITVSPEVYLYTEDRLYATKTSGWLKVGLKSGTKDVITSKNNSQGLKLTIELPERYTQRLI